jgi:hypothetical protein
LVVNHLLVLAVIDGTAELDAIGMFLECFISVHNGNDLAAEDLPFDLSVLYITLVEEGTTDESSRVHDGYCELLRIQIGSGDDRISMVTNNVSTAA